MNTFVAPLDRVRARSAAVPAWLVATLGVGGLVLLSAWLRSRAMLAGFWIDEGLSVGIADRPLLDIPGVLRLDGAPPLYYMLLHVWMDLRGMGEGDTHALSLLFALLCVPAAWVAARLLWGPREAWTSAVVAAVLPYLTYYAQETRMYALVALLSLAVAATFALAFVHRRRGALPLLSLSLLLILYTHNWALFLTAGTLAAFAGLWLTAPGERRALLRDAALAYVPVALLYAPWVPTLLFQAAHTGAPWAEQPGLGQISSGFKQMLGAQGGEVAALLGAGAGWAALVAGRRRLGETSRAARTAAAVAGLLLAAVLLAWAASQVSPAWANRYFAVFVGPGVLLLGVGFARGGRMGLVALLLATLLWLDTRTDELHAKSNAAHMAHLFNARVQPGDLAVITHPEQIAVASYYLPDELRWADALGPVADTGVFDWRDALERLQAAEPEVVSDRLIRTLEPGQRLLLVQPIIRGQRWNAPWTALVRRRAGEWERILDRDPRLRRVDTRPRFGLRRPSRGLRGVLYVRRGPPLPPAARG